MTPTTLWQKSLVCNKTRNQLCKMTWMWLCLLPYHRIISVLLHASLRHLPKIESVFKTMCLLLRAALQLRHKIRSMLLLDVPQHLRKIISTSLHDTLEHHCRSI
jgi:hypothetical protein